MCSAEVLAEMFSHCACAHSVMQFILHAFDKRTSTAAAMALQPAKLGRGSAAHMNNWLLGSQTAAPIPSDTVKT